MPLTSLHPFSGAFLSIMTLSAVFLAPAVHAAGFDPAPLESAVQDIETRLPARVGVTVLDTETGAEWHHKGAERFPTNSTFKAFLCAALLDAGDKGVTDPERRIEVRESDIVSYSPVLEKNVGGRSFSLMELCEITVTVSDNAAANLVLAEIGGPAGLTAFLRGIGDRVTRLDRWEPESNSGIPADARDTTSPDAAASTLRNLVLGSVLTPQSGKTLTGWLERNRVGARTLRAGLPKDWRIADKTGAGANGSRSNIAVIWPEGRKPVVVAVYITQSPASIADRNLAIAEIGSALAASLVP